MKYFLKLSGIILILIITALATQFFRLVPAQTLFKVSQQNYVAQSSTEHSQKILNESDRYLLLYSDADEGSRAVYSNATHSFRMAKINYDKINIENKWHVDQFNIYKSIIFATESIHKIDRTLLTRIKQYVQNGGRVIFLVRGYFPDYNSFIGIKENNGYLNRNLYGFDLNQKLFPGLNDTKINSRLITHSLLDVRLEKQVEVLASTADSVPLIWSNSYGKGVVIFVNSSMLEDKLNRGVLLQILGYKSDYFLTTIFNGKLLDIDDFPSPIKRGKDPIIFNEYGMDNSTFFKNIWWSTIHNIGAKYNVKYTGLLIGVYNLFTRLPVPDLNKSDINDLIYFGRKLAEINGEIGIHGYNHNSLVLRGQMFFGDYGYSEWESQSTMEKSLIKVRDEMQNIYGDIPIYSYVPPSNIISTEGKLAVASVFKDLKIIAGIYTGNPEKGVEYQEFGPDPVLKGVYNLPRISAGYHYSSAEMWAIYNGIASYGIFNHFIHPDDVLDPNRSGDKTWKELAKEFETIIAETHEYFPFLRPMTNIEGYDIIKNLENLKVYSKKVNDIIRVQYDMAVFPVYHYLKLIDKKVQTVNGGKFELIESNSEYSLYLIQGEQESVEIALK